MPVPIVAFVLGAAVAPKVGGWLIDRGKALIDKHLPATKERLGGVDILDFIPFGKTIKDSYDAEDEAAAEARRVAKAAKAAAKEAKEDLNAEKAMNKAKQTVAALRAELTATARAAADKLAAEQQLRALEKQKGENQAKGYRSQLAKCRQQVKNLQAYSAYAAKQNKSPTEQGLYETVNESMQAPDAVWPDADIYGLPAPEPMAGVMLQVQGGYDPTSFMSPQWTGGYDV